MALRTKIGGTVGLAQGLDQRPASPAGFAGPAIDPVAQLEFAEPAIGMGEVPQAAATGTYRLAQGGLDCGHQTVQARCGDLVGRRPRIDASTKKAFGSIYVADADNNARVHDRWLDGGPAAAQGSCQAVAAKVAGERLDTQVGQKRVGGGVAVDPEHGAESAGIAQAKNPVAEVDVQMVMSFRAQAWRHDTQAAGHAQVKQEMTAAEIEQQVFAPPADVEELPAGQPFSEVCRQRVAEGRRPCIDAPGAAADQLWRESLAGDLDFRQFGHDGKCLSLGEAAKIDRLLYVRPGFPPDPAPRMLTTMKRRLLPALLAACVLSVQAADEAADANVLPRQELTPQILYQFLLAEIAGSRGEAGLSAEAYADLATRTRDPRIARRAAEIGLFARRYDLALTSARLWLELEPASAQARQTVAGLMASAGQSDDLSAHLTRQLAAAGSEVGPQLMQLNRMMARHPDKSAVQRVIDQVTTPYLGLAEAHFARAQAAHNAKDGATALREIERALELRPDWEHAALVRAQLTANSGEALSFLADFVAAHPKASEVRLVYARSLVNDKRYGEARREFQTLLAENQSNGDIIYAVAVLSIQLNDLDDAERHLKRLIELGYAEINNVRIYLGQIAEERQQWGDALKWYDQVGAGEQYLPARMRVAHVLSRQGKLADARRSLQESTASNARERGQLLIAEAQLLREAGHYGDAYKVLDGGLSQHPDQVDLLYESALAAERVGKNDVVERNLRRLIDIKPDHAHAYNALGYSLADRNERLDEALQLIDKALQLAPEDPFILDSKGWVLFRRGDAKAALEVLQKAFGLRADPEIAAHLGEVLWTLGRRDEATKTWSEAIKANPTNEVLVGTVKKFQP